MMPTNRYIILRDWMFGELELSLPEAVVYAYIYGRTTDRAMAIHDRRHLAADIAPLTGSLSQRRIYEIFHRLEQRYLLAFEKRDAGLFVRAFRQPYTAQTVLNLAESVRPTAEIVRPAAIFPQTPIYKDNNKEKREEGEEVEEESAAASAAAVLEKEKEEGPPDWETVKLYIQERQVAYEVAEKWFRYRSRFGWRVKDQPIVCWRADLMDWVAREKEGRPGGASPLPSRRGVGGGVSPGRLPRDIELDRRREADYQRFRQQRDTPGWNEMVDRICKQITERS